MKKNIIMTVMAAAIYCFVAENLLAANCAVTTTASSGNGSLAAQIADANCSKITFSAAIAGTLDAPTEITLTKTSSFKANNVTLDGEDKYIILKGSLGNNVPLLSIPRTGVTVKNLTIENTDGIGISITKSGNNILQNKFQNLSIGVKVVTGTKNKISKNDFSGVSTSSIALFSGGNENFASPSNVAAELIYPEVWQLTGNLDTLTSQVEIYEADKDNLSVPQGKYLKTITNDGASFTEEFLLETNLPNKAYTLLAIKDNGSTSQLSDAFVPAELTGFFANFPDCATASWLFNDTSSGWLADNDAGGGDGLLNEQEDIDKDCVVDKNSDGTLKETDPGNADSDGDAFSDLGDNCPFISNPNQSDVNGDGVGDVCGQDADGDLILNISDNCPLISNAGQSDTDADTQGDACDIDRDGDGTLDSVDNCLYAANPGQTDTDSEGPGDACDEDDDGDGVNDDSDNCPLNANPDQTDANENGLGAACDETDSPEIIPAPPSENPPPEENPTGGEEAASSGGCSLIR